MKRKIITISLLIILLLITILMSKKTNNKTFFKDGVMFAVVVDGEDSLSFPVRGKYYVDIECENAQGKWLADSWKMSLENITGNVSCSVMFTSITDSDYNKNIKTEILNSVGTSGEGSIVNEGIAGIRYEGKNPNNYIWFNNEMWRIIGSIPVCLTSDCGNSNTLLVKIIRNQTIGTIAYDAKTTDNETSEWGNNTLYKLLNEYYYGRKNGNNSNYCYGYSNTASSFCDYTYTGLSIDDYYGSMIQNVYWNTGKGTYSQSTNDIYASEKNKQSIQGRVGLISASDYGYATNYGRSNLASYANINYTGTNWLYGKGNEMTLTQFDNKEYLRINMSGSLINENATVGHVFRPVVYLNESVYIVSGDGTEANPYQIAK